MPEPDFSRLAADLRRAGIAPRHIRRSIAELRDHYVDLLDAQAKQEKSEEIAQARASEQLGSFDDIVAAMRQYPELRTWSFRFPRIALCVYPLACLMALPAAPIAAGIVHRESIVKWGAALLTAGFLTASLMLILQLSILFG